jgi:hypothetical protein
MLTPEHIVDGGGERRRPSQIWNTKGPRSSFKSQQLLHSYQDLDLIKSLLEQALQLLQLPKDFDVRPRSKVHDGEHGHSVLEDLVFPTSTYHEEEIAVG